MAAALDHKVAAGIGFFIGFIDGEQLEPALAMISEAARGIKAKVTPL